jgi:hypothetical protein
MNWTRRIAPALATAAICVAASGTPALAETHWSKSQCTSWEKSYLKRHKHPSKSEKAKANKVLKAHGCSVRVK